MRIVKRRKRGAASAESAVSPQLSTPAVQCVCVCGGDGANHLNEEAPSRTYTSKPPPPPSHFPDTGLCGVRNGPMVPEVSGGSRAAHFPPIPTSLPSPGLSVLQSHTEVSPG